MTLKTVTLALAFLIIFLMGKVHAQKILLNVSYDPTRELYKEFNPAFVKYWQSKTGESVSFKLPENSLIVPCLRMDQHHPKRAGKSRYAAENINRIKSLNRPSGKEICAT
jgi:hypothetical protein